MRWPTLTVRLLAEVTKAISQLLEVLGQLKWVSNLLIWIIEQCRLVFKLVLSLSFLRGAEVNTIVEFIAPAEHRTKSGVFILSLVLQIPRVGRFLLVNRNDSGFSNSRNSPVRLPLPNRFSPKTPYCAYCGRRLGNNNKLRFLW